MHEQSTNHVYNIWVIEVPPINFPVDTLLVKKQTSEAVVESNATVSDLRPRTVRAGFFTVGGWGFVAVIDWQPR